MRSRFLPRAGVLILILSSAAVAQNQPVEQKGTPTPATGPQKQAPTTPNAPTAPAVQSPAPATAPGQAQTTPGQASQITPALTGQTPSGQTTGTAAQTPQFAPATAADVKGGVSVYDEKGAIVGKIDSVSSAGAVINTGAVRVTIPVSSFAKSDKGLVISTTKAELDASAKASAKTKATTKKTK